MNARSHAPDDQEMVMADRPTVPYACIHNSGRRVAGMVLTRHHAGDAVEVRSAGSEPGKGVNPVVAQVLAERGLSTEGHDPAGQDINTVRRIVDDVDGRVRALLAVVRD